ncbi:hypothetical protein ACJX0J_038230, partial [Zea mays]
MVPNLEIICDHFHKNVGAHSTENKFHKEGWTCCAVRIFSEPYIEQIPLSDVGLSLNIGAVCLYEELFLVRVRRSN